MPKARILVVEDEVIIALDIQRTLTKMGYDVPEFVTSAESALERIAAVQPNLVLMDIHLNGAVDGIAAADEIRWRDHLPVVFLTAHSDEATLKRAKIAEPYGYVLKPFEERELQIAIDIALYRHSAEMKLRQMERWLSTTLKSLGDGVIAVSTHGNITFMNRMAEVLTGWPQHEALGRPLEEVLRLFYQAADTTVDNLLERVQTNGLVIDLSPGTTLINREGEPVPIETSAAPIRDESEREIGVVIVFRELNARQYVEGRLRHLSAHDALTGLPNEILLGDRLSMAFEHAKRYPDYSFALLIVDLDHFRLINGSHGEAFGDLVLSAVAQRLRESLRSVDTLSRSGADEFAILLHHIGDLADVVHITRRILRKITDAIIIDGQEVFLSASIGIVLSDPRYQRTEDMLHDAAFALHQAKTQESGHFRVFNTAQHQYAMRLKQLEAGLSQAVERREFRIFYQPIVTLADGALCGFETLLYWQYSEHSLLPPGDFLPLAEKTGILIEISEWILGEACRRLQSWQQLAPANAALSIAVNLSPMQFLHPSLKDHLSQALAASGLEARHLCLEIPEEVAAADPLVSAHILAELGELGVRLHLDDFNAACPALDILENPSIHNVKIDRSVVRSITGTAGGKSAIVRSILSLANELGKQVSADGIETAEQAERLLSWGCRFGQGNHYGKPLTAEDVERVFTSGAGFTG
jgi:diguanylate cyclase (GGDEF)-like protein/PAS domain S-box-containing protein